MRATRSRRLNATITVVAVLTSLLTGAGQSANATAQPGSAVVADSLASSAPTSD